LEKTRSSRTIACVGFLGIWLVFSVFLYVILFLNQQNIFGSQIDADTSFIRELIGWELRRQTTWAILMIFSFIGIFSAVRLLRDYSSTYVRALLSLPYFGFALFFQYCLLKLFWSCQTVRMFELLLGKTAGVSDPVQVFLFATDGTMKTEGAIVVTASAGLVAALLFHVFTFFFLEKGGARREREFVVERARAFLQAKPEVASAKVRRALTQVEGIGQKASAKLKEAGVKDIEELAASKPEEIAKTLGVSSDKASEFVKRARSLLEDRSRKRRRASGKASKGLVVN